MGRIKKKKIELYFVISAEISRFCREFFFSFCFKILIKFYFWLHQSSKTLTINTVWGAYYVSIMYLEVNLSITVTLTHYCKYVTPIIPAYYPIITNMLPHMYCHITPHLTFLYCSRIPNMFSSHQLPCYITFSHYHVPYFHYYICFTIPTVL